MINKFTKTTIRIFLSYSTPHKDQVHEIKKALEKAFESYPEFEIKVFFSHDDLILGDNMKHVIRSKIEESDILIFYMTDDCFKGKYMSEDSFEREWIKEEFHLAKSLKKRIIPIKAGKKKLKGTLKDIYSLDFYNFFPEHQSFINMTEKLVRDILRYMKREEDNKQKTMSNELYHIDKLPNSKAIITASLEKKVQQLHYCNSHKEAVFVFSRIKEEDHIPESYINKIIYIYNNNPNVSNSRIIQKDFPQFIEKHKKQQIL